MGVVGTRVPPVLEQNIRDHCRGLGKTPSVWLRELVEREISGKTPGPALGDAIKGLNEVASDNTKLVISVLAASLGIYNTIIQSEIANHPVRANQLEKTRSEFVVGLLKNLPLKKEQLTVEMGFRVSDLASEIERIQTAKQIRQEGSDG